MSYKTGDIILAKSFAGPEVYVRLKKRITSKKGWDADGWDGVIIYKKDVDALRKKGVPYEKNQKPMVFVFDWQMIKKKQR